MFNHSFKLFCLLLLAFGSPSYAALYLESPVQNNLLTDGKLHLFLCGTGDPEVTMQAVRKPACLAMIVDKQFMLFDAGEGAIQTLASIGLPYKAIHNVFITHWHSDHFAGLGQVINTTWNKGRNEPINIFGPYGVEQIVKGLANIYQLDVIFRSTDSKGRLDPQLGFGVPKLVDAVKKDQTVYSTPDLKITAFLVSHEPVYPAVGYVVQYKGCKIVISGDTKVTTTLADHAKDADLLINEVLSNPLSQEIYQRAMAKGDKLNAAFSLETKNYHSDSLELAKMAQQAKVKHLVLTHFVPAIPPTPSAEQAFVKGMSESYTGPITISADKDEIDIESTGIDACQIKVKPAQRPANIPVYKIN